MSDITWRDQYKHPMWQKKRLEALENAGYLCQKCYDGESTLHVHHKRYAKGRKVWEYTVGELSVLCEGCHQEVHADQDALKEILVRLHPEGWSEVVGLVAGYCHNAVGPCHINLSDTGILGVSPFLESVGRLAAEATHLRIEEINELSNALDLYFAGESSYTGGVVGVSVSARRKPEPGDPF